MRSKKNPSNKQRPRVVEPEDDDDDELIETGAAVDDDTDLDEELRALDEELGADATTAKVVVHKVIPNGESARCFSCPRSQFFSDQIREQWGAGTYSILVYLKGKIKARHRLTFAEPAKAVVAPATPAAADPGVRDLEARFERDRARDLELMKLFMGGRPAVDPLQMQTQILSMLTAVKELTGGAPKSSGSDRSAIDLVLEGVKLAQRLGNGGGEGSTDWGQVIASAVEGMKLIAESTPPAPAAAGAPKLRVIAGGASAPQTQTPATPASSATPEEPDMMEKLRTQLQLLVRKAEKNADPELYAEVVIDNIAELPAFMQQLALGYLTRPDALERLMTIEPAVGQHREWFLKCLEEIGRLLSPQEGADPLTDGTATPEAED